MSESDSESVANAALLGRVASEENDDVQPLILLKTRISFNSHIPWPVMPQELCRKTIVENI